MGAMKKLLFALGIFSSLVPGLVTLLGLAYCAIWPTDICAAVPFAWILLWPAYVLSAVLFALAALAASDKRLRFASVVFLTLVGLLGALLWNANSTGSSAEIAAMEFAKDNQEVIRAAGRIKSIYPATKSTNVLGLPTRLEFSAHGSKRDVNVVIDISWSLFTPHFDLLCMPKKDLGDREAFADICTQ